MNFVEYLPAVRGAKVSIGGSGRVSGFDGTRAMFVVLCFGSGGGTRSGIACNEALFERGYRKEC